MLSFKSLALFSLLSSSALSTPLPTTTRPRFLNRRGLALLGGSTGLDAGLLSHAGAQVGHLVGAGADVFAHAGASIGPDGVKVDAEVCLDLVVTLGQQKVLDAAAVLALTAGLSSKGVPASVGAVVDAHVLVRLLSLLRRSIPS